MLKDVPVRDDDEAVAANRFWYPAGKGGRVKLRVDNDDDDDDDFPFWVVTKVVKKDLDCTVVVLFCAMTRSKRLRIVANLPRTAGGLVAVSTEAGAE